MCMTQIRSMGIELVDQLALPCKFVYFEKLEYITVYPTLCAAPMFLLTLYIFIFAELYVSYLHVLFSNGSYITGGRRITCGIEVRECLVGLWNWNIYAGKAFDKTYNVRVEQSCGTGTRWNTFSIPFSSTLEPASLIFFFDHLVFGSTLSPSNKDFRFRAQTKYPSKRMDGLVGLNVAVFILVTCTKHYL